MTASDHVSSDVDLLVHPDIRIGRLDGFFHSTIGYLTPTLYAVRAYMTRLTLRKSIAIGIHPRIPHRTKPAHKTSTTPRHEPPRKVDSGAATDPDTPKFRRFPDL